MLYDILAGMGEMMVKGTIAVGRIAFETTALLGEVIVETFSQGNSSSSSSSYYDPKEENNATYEYWKSLDYRQQEEYFNNNEYLKDYIKNDYYPNDRELTAKHVQHIADKLNKEFTDRYNNY